MIAVSSYVDQLRQLRSVHIEPGGRAEVPVIVLSRDVDPPGAGVGEHHCQPYPTRLLGNMTFRLGVLVRVGEAEEEVEDRGRDSTKDTFEEEKLRLTLSLFTLHRTIVHHISPPVLTATLARLESTNVKIADRLVGSGTMLRAGHL